MNATSVFNLLLAFFALLGGIDYLLDDRFGIGKEFARGIHCAGNLCLCMISFMTLAPWFGQVLGPLVSPFLSLFGADPSLIAGILLSVDSGGAVLAESMTSDEGAIFLNGFLVSAMMGSAFNGNIPLSVMAVPKERRKPVLTGLSMGVASIPAGAFLGGILGGVKTVTLVRNLIPLFILSAVLVFSMLAFGDRMIGVLKAVGKINVAICVTGVLIALLGELAGIEILPARMDFTEIMVIIGRCVLTLCGMFPLMAVVLKVFRRPILALAGKMRLPANDCNCLFIDLVNCFSSIDQLKDMSDLGIMVNAAFGIGAGYVLGDHFAYVSAVKPDLLLPFILGKLSAGILSVVLVYLIAGKTGKKA